MNIEKKKVLLIGMNFRDYENSIKSAIEQQGYMVDLVCDNTDFISRVQNSFSTSIGYKLLAIHQRKIVNMAKRKKYEYIIIIVGRFLLEETMIGLRAANKDSEIILYLWDDVNRVSNYEITEKYCDRKYSFDLNDIIEYDLEFLPLFYLKRYEEIKSNKFEYDVYSAMNDHSDRVNVSINFVNNYPSLRTKICFVTNWRNLKRRKSDLEEKEAGRITFQSKDLEKKKMLSDMKNSKAFIDVPFKGQNGLTIRTFESIAGQKKLITTNENIKKYDFFCPQNIFIINPDNPRIDLELFNEEYVELPIEIYNKYSVDTWVKVILTGKNNDYLKG